MHGDGTMDSAHIPWPVNADHAMPPHAGIAIMKLVDPQFLHRPAWNAFEPVADVNVGKEDNGVLLVGTDSVRDDRRRRCLAKRHRLQQSVARLFMQQDHIIEHIHEVDAPKRLVVRLAGDKEKLVVQRIGMQEFRPGASDQVVLNNRRHVLAVTGDPLDRTIGFKPGFGRIEDGELTHSRNEVMAGNDGDDFAGIARDRTRVEHGIGPVGIAPVVFHLAGTVRVHVEEEAREEMGRIAVLPARIQYSTIMKKRGAPVVVLVETELADVLAVGIHDAEVGNPCAAADTGHALKTPRGSEDDLSAWQVAGVVIVHIRMFTGGYLPQARPVVLDLPDLPSVVLAEHGEDHPVGIEMQIHVSNEEFLLGTEESRESGFSANRRKYGDIVVVDLAARKSAVAQPVMGKSKNRTLGPAPDDEKFPEIEQRIGEQCFAL